MLWMRCCLVCKTIINQYVIWVISEQMHDNLSIVAQMKVAGCTSYRKKYKWIINNYRNDCDRHCTFDLRIYFTCTCVAQNTEKISSYLYLFVPWSKAFRTNWSLIMVPRIILHYTCFRSFHSKFFSSSEISFIFIFFFVAISKLIIPALGQHWEKIIGLNKSLFSLKFSEVLVLICTKDKLNLQTYNLW